MAAPARLFPYPYRSETLPNGLKVILIPMPSQGLVAYYSIVRTGSRDEVEPGKSGFAHFFEHMMFRGTKTHPAEEYDRILTEMGASHNAFTSSDVTVYYNHVTRDDLERIVELEADRFQNLEYAEPAFRTEAGAVYGEYRKNITSPYAMLDEKLNDLAFDVHTYKHTTIGFERDIKAMPEAFGYSRGFFERFYRPDNTVILVVGDFDPDATLASIRGHYGSWKRGYVAPKVVPEPPQTEERSGEVVYPGKTLPILDMAYKGDAFDASNRKFVAALLLVELAFGETSDLFKDLYVKRQKVERLMASAPMHRDAPLFEVVAVIKKPEDVPEVRAAIEAAIARYQKKPPDAKRLADLKRRWRYTFLMRLDSPQRVAGALIEAISLTGGIEATDALLRAVDQVTARDVMEAARTYYQKERRTVVTVKGQAS